MITFTDGPAAGVELVLERTPVMLRVVRAANGEWDALDQPEDDARPGEAVFVYRLAGKPSRTFVDFRDQQGRRRGQCVMYAAYAHWPEPVAPEDLTPTSAWRSWVDRNWIRILEPRA